MGSAAARAHIERALAARRAATANPSPPRSLEQERREWDEFGATLPLPEGARVEAVDAGSVSAEWIDTPGAHSGRVLLLLHGGGYSSGSPRTHRKLAANLSLAASARVLTPDYRLAPEHPFPAGVDDSVRVYRWLLDQDSDASDIILAGDSAGAGLALSTLIALRDRRLPMPRAAVLMSAWTDLTASSPSLDTLRDVDIQVTREDLRQAGRVYVGDGDPADPRASTLFADLSGLPPLLMQVGGHEVLLDDSRIFAERARAAGVDATLTIHDGMWHVFQFEAPEIPEAQAAMDEIAAFIRAQFGD